MCWKIKSYLRLYPTQGKENKLSNIHRVEIFKWKWENTTCDYVVGLPKDKEKSWCDLGSDRSTNKVCSLYSSSNDNENGPTG